MNPVGTPALQRALSDTSKALHAAGWVANHDGNVSVRLPDATRFMCTPTATSKRDVEPSDIITVDIEGKVLSGRKRPFGEWHLHAACFRARDDANAVIHAHPPNATAFGLTRTRIGTPALPEMVVSLGAYIPLLDYAMPKDAHQERMLEKALADDDAEVALLAGNGVIAVGADLEQAYLRLELVEHYAKILIAAKALGGVTPLPDRDVQLLLAARTKAGLGREGRRGR